MSVLVPTFVTNSHHHHCQYPNRYSSTSKKSIPVVNRSASNCSETTSNDSSVDHVPIGVVNSMKQRLLDKFNESLLVNSNTLLNRHSIHKSSNDNLLQTKSTLKQTSRLSRSDENLLNHSSEPINSYLQVKTDLIIVDKTPNNEQFSPHRHSHLDIPVDEVPKPGTVITVKNMFEKQIRQSRSDIDRHSNSSSARLGLRSPTRSRSVSPNDMAVRQRRATIPPSTNTYPDVIISHTPPPSSATTETIINNHLSNSMNDRQNSETNLSSDTNDYEPMDFKSRLALFNRAKSNEKTVENPIPLITNKKSSTVEVTSSNFLSQPVLLHSTEGIPSAKIVTFFGGAKIDDNEKQTLIAPNISPSVPEESFQSPDVIGGLIKLSKSSLHSGLKRNVRVQFIEHIETFEYLSYDAAMAEFADDINNDDDDENLNIQQDLTEDDIDDELEKLAKVNADFNAKNVAEKTLESKGSLHTFRPTHLDSYELGRKQISDNPTNSSDISSIIPEDSFSSVWTESMVFKQGKLPFDLPNHIQWSSMTANSDLLF